MILEHLRAAVLAALADHGLDQPKTFFARVVRKVGDRLSVQKIDAKDNADDANPIEVWPGVPGVSSDPKDGEQVVVTLVGQKQVPVVTHRNDPSGPLPVEVRHNAITAIRMLSKAGSASAKVYVGSTTFPLARAADLLSLVTTLQALGASLSLNPSPDVAAVGAAITTALLGFTVTPTTKLEAQ